MKKTKKKAINRLPEKLWQLLERAITDAQKIEHMPGYELDMQSWVGIFEEGQPCQVCLAGSVMVCTLKAQKSKYFTTEMKSSSTVHMGPEDFGDETLCRKLNAIDYMRCGDFKGALTQLHGVGGIENLTLAEIFVLDALEAEVSDYVRDSNEGKAPWDVYDKAIQVLELIDV